MSLATTSQATTCSVNGKSEIFQDLPIFSRLVRLNILELKHSDKQIINELVYRCCRILTRKKTSDQNCRVQIIDTIGSMNPIRLATVLKRESARLRQIQVSRHCKINPTYITLCAHLKKDTVQNQPKLFVIYHDEFFIMKTLNLLKEFLPNSRSQVILVLPELNRQAHDVLNVMPSNQILKCDFAVERKEIGPAPPGFASDSYQRHLNQVHFSRSGKNNNLPKDIDGELREDGLHLHVIAPARASLPSKTSFDTTDGPQPNKRFKTNLNNTIA